MLTAKFELHSFTHHPTIRYIPLVRCITKY